MKIGQLFIAGIDTYLPPPVSVKQAVADGRYDAKEAAETALESILVSDEAPPDMAIHAARGALARSGIDPAAISLVFHASCNFQGLEFMPTASYIHNAVLGDHCDVNHSALTLEIKAASNGGLSGLELAAAYLAASPDRAAALVTTADNFCSPLFERWQIHSGLVPADGASAMVLSRQRGFARVLSIATVSNPNFVSTYRGHEPFRRAPTPIVHRRKTDDKPDVGLDEHSRRFRSGMRAAVDRALHDSQTELTGIAYFLLSHIGRNLLDREYYRELKIQESATTWRFGRCTGHLGAGDQIVGLSLLMDHGALNPGDRCMMIGVGSGFTWTCAVIEIQERLPLRPSPLFT
jgi:3-oxoacyl-[acyl-carrier-protein] synthase-3